VLTRRSTTGNAPSSRSGNTRDRGAEIAALDAYVQVLRAGAPGASALVFSCGTGAVRTTFGMVVASLVRRVQLGADAPRGTMSPGMMSPGLSAPGARAATPIGLGLPSELARAATVGD
jgi:hypothetical protein